MKKDYVKPVATKIEIKLDENIAESQDYTSDSTGWSYTNVPAGSCYDLLNGEYQMPDDAAEGGAEYRQWYIQTNITVGLDFSAYQAFKVQCG